MRTTNLRQLFGAIWIDPLGRKWLLLSQGAASLAVVPAKPVRSEPAPRTQESHRELALIV